MRRVSLFCTVLALAVITVYWPVGSYSFIDFDDPEFIENNVQIRSGLSWATVQYAFTSPVVGNWHPITTLSHALDCEFFGLNAGAHHVVSVVIHAINAVLLFLLILRLRPTELLDRAKPSEGSSLSWPTLWFATFVSGAFALHPLRVESVAWVSERKDVLSGMFFLLTLLCYASYARRGPGRAARTRYFAALGCFALGLMCKPMLVTLPFILLLLDFWPLNRLVLNWPRIITEKSPFFGLSAISSIITLNLQGSGMAPLVKLSLIERVINSVQAYGIYLKKMVWPTDLAVFYPHELLGEEVSSHGFEFAATALVLICITGVAVRFLKARPYLAMGWFWFLGMIIPVIGLVQVGEQAMADRYTYLPMLGINLALAALLLDRKMTRRYSTILWVSCLLLLAALAVVTRFQLYHWRGTVPLFSHTLKVTGENPNAEFALAVGLEKQGNSREAEERYLKVISRHPGYTEAHYNLGRLFMKEERWEVARKYLEIAIAQKPFYKNAKASLATVLIELGDERRALGLFEEALSLQPDSSGLLNNIAWLLATANDEVVRNGRLAVSYSTRACELTGRKNPQFLGTLAAAFAETGDFDSAIDTANDAIALAERLGEVGLAEKNRALLRRYADKRKVSSRDLY